MFTAIPDDTAAVVTIERDCGEIVASLRETDDIAPLTREQIAAVLRALADRIASEELTPGPTHARLTPVQGVLPDECGDLLRVTGDPRRPAMRT